VVRSSPTYPPSPVLADWLIELPEAAVHKQK
jgi:hypothetical protein